MLAKIISIFDWIFSMKDAILGSFMYSLYAHIFMKKSVITNLASFFMGAVFSVYLSGPLHSLYPSFKIEVIGFVMGLTGMKFIEVLLLTNWKDLLIKKIFTNESNSNKLPESNK